MRAPEARGPRGRAPAGAWTALLLRASARVYRLLLLRYPRRLRDRFGHDMVALFRARAEDLVAERGLAGLGLAWWHALRDLMRSSPGPVSAARSPRQGSRDPRGSTGPAGLRSRLGALREDVAFAFRALRREPRFTGLVVVVLAVGIAFNVTVFAVLNAYLLRPLPYPAAERLVAVDAGGVVSWTEVDHLFERAASWDLDVFTIIGDGRPRLATGAWVTPDFLDMYGVRPRLGRGFAAKEAGRDAAPVAMISHRLWQERFGGSPDIVGRTFRAFTSDRPDHAEVFEIVGVLPADFWYFNDYTDVLAPIRSDRNLYAARLRADVPLERARAGLTELARARLDGRAGFQAEVTPLHDLHVARIRPTLLVVQAAVVLVLLIACANAAVLIMIRSARRERELGVRRALGASRLRVARQLLSEGALLAGAAGTLGCLAALGALGGMRDTLESRIGLRVPGGADLLAIDGTVLLATVAASAVVGVVSGLVPLLTSARAALAPALREGARGGTESRARLRVRSAMVAAEIALSLALLTGAGLMVRSAIDLQTRALGWSPERVERAEVGVREASHPTPADRVALFAELVARAEALPGIEGAALASRAIFSTRFESRVVEGEAADGVARGEAVAWTVSEGYFALLGIPVVRGRGLAASDAEGSQPVAVVSERLARDLWGAADPVGRTVRIPPFTMPGSAPPADPPWLRVVGVVADVERDVGGGRGGDVYLSFRQGDAAWLEVLTRRQPGTGPVMPAVEAALHELDPEAPMFDPRELDDAVAEAMAPTRYLAGILGAFSGFAVLLAVLGLYGVVSYAARQRARDVAIRMALGADRGSVVGLFLRNGLAVVAAGIVLGSLGGRALGGGLRSQLHGVQPGDVLTHVGLALLLAVTSAVAVWLPARRAASTDPMGVLREE